jgi:dienelactone hydrolase
LSRAIWLVVAFALALPALGALHQAATSTMFLVEFLSNGRWRPLSLVTESPKVERLPPPASKPDLAADLYLVPALLKRPGLVLVHGIAPLGKDDPHVGRGARVLARAGWAVAAPTIEGLTVLRLRPEDADAVVASVEALADAGHEPVAILGISLGSSPAFLAAGDPRVASSVSAVAALGGYASAVELLRYTLTGAYEFGDTRGRRPPVDETAIARFAQANREFVDAAGRRLVDNRDPEAWSRLAADLSPDTRRLLDDLSPERALPRIEAPIFLVHGLADTTVPFTESLRLDHAARTAGRRVTTSIVGAVSHVDPDMQAMLRDLWRVGAAFHAFRTTATRPPPADGAGGARRAGRAAGRNGRDVARASCARNPCRNSPSAGQLDATLARP